MTAPALPDRTQPGPGPLAGVIPVLETPFDADGEIDVAGFERLVERLLSSGVDGLMFPGFASEFVKLDPHERRLLEQVLADRAGTAGVLSVISVPEHSTLAAVKHARWAVQQGAAALNVLPPYLMQPSQESVVDHVRQVLQAVPDTPVIVQVAPALVGSALGAGDLLQLATDHRNLSAVKVEAVPPGRMVGRLAPRGLPCLVGYAGLYLPDALSRGAAGVQPGCSFVELYVQLWQRWTAGDETGFLSLHGRMLPFLLGWMHDAELIVAVEKLISVERGMINSSYCRAPSYRLDAQEQASVRRFLDQFGDLLPGVTATHPAGPPAGSTQGETCASTT